MKIEINHGAGGKSEVVFIGRSDIVDLNAIYKKFIEEDKCLSIEIFEK